MVRLQLMNAKNATSYPCTWRSVCETASVVISVFLLALRYFNSKCRNMLSKFGLNNNTCNVRTCHSTCCCRL